MIVTQEQVNQAIGTQKGEEEVVKITSAYKSDQSNTILPNQKLPEPAPASESAGGVMGWQNLVPEQFRAESQTESLQKMAAAYNELNQANTKYQEELKGYEHQVTDLTAPEETAEEAFGKSLAKTFDDNNIDGLDMKDRFFRYEELTSADHKKLEEAGINPTLFENSLLQERTNAALQVKEEQQKEQLQNNNQAQKPKRLNDQDYQTILKEYANGNLDQFNAMADWGTQNFGVNAMQGIQEAIDTGKVNVARAAIGGLHTAYVASQGQEKPLSVTGGQPASYGVGEVDFAEAQKIFNDPRYKARDPASRAWRMQQMQRKWL